MRPVLGGLRVADRLHHVPVGLQPLGGRSVQRLDQRRVEPPQLETQQIGEQVVVAEPRPPDIQRGHERAGVLELLQHSLGSRAAGQEVGQRAADALQHGRTQQEIADLGRLALEHLGQQVPRDRALAAGELAHEPLGIGMLGERDRRQPQTRRPALGTVVQQRQIRIRERDPGPLQQLARLFAREAKSRGPDLGQGTRHAEAMQAERGFRTGYKHDPRLWRQPSEEQLERRQRVGRLQLVQIVDHQHDGPLQRLQIRQQPFDDELTAQTRSRADPRDRRVSADCVHHGQPEPLPVALAALDRHPCRPIAGPGRLQPRADQHRLATSRRAAHHDHAAGRRGRQVLEQLAALDQAPPRKDWVTRGRRRLEHAADHDHARMQPSRAPCAIRNEYVPPGAPITQSV